MSDPFISAAFRTLNTRKLMSLKSKHKFVDTCFANIHAFEDIACIISLTSEGCVYTCKHNSAFTRNAHSKEFLRRYMYTFSVFKLNKI